MARHWSSQTPSFSCVCLLATCLGLWGSAVTAQTESASFTAFESGQVRPLALARSNPITRLFAVNTPDARVEVFDVDPDTGLLTQTESVPVGLEPVAIAARSVNEFWVVNHLSDSVSVVRKAGVGEPWRTVATLSTEDEPRDIVFAGPNRSRTYVST